MKTLQFATLVALYGFSHSANAEPLNPQAIDMVWLATASALVFLMQAGFALLESGLSRSKNAVNVIMKNYMDVCIGSIIFWAVGFGLMFGINHSGFYGESGFFLGQADDWEYGFLLFQMMFAATAATIASGAMAERATYNGYLLGAVCICGFIYPVFGSWAWGSFYDGSGWLAEMGFIDFAGSTVVHSVGAWSALAAILVLGPRLGRFDDQGQAREISGHNVSYVALGGLLLWFGWFGFNGGSTVSADVSIGLINLNTQLAAAAGAIAALVISLLLGKAILVANIVNGSLAGLVGITAGCATMEPAFALLTGFTSSVIAYICAELLLKQRLDDVVGAISVHGAAGAWGTLCAGFFVTGNLFNPDIIVVQCLGIISCFVWTFSCAFLTYLTIDKLVGLRAEPLDEQRGLDITEHAEIGYPEFHTDTAYNKATLTGIERS